MSKGKHGNNAKKPNFAPCGAIGTRRYVAQRTGSGFAAKEGSAGAASVQSLANDRCRPANRFDPMVGLGRDVEFADSKTCRSVCEGFNGCCRR